MTCRNCKHDKFAVDEMDGAQFHWCKKYYDSYDDSKAEECESYEPKTNADKIRNMTDEELAKFFFEPNQEFCRKCKYLGSDCDGLYCKESMLEWLKHPAEGE